MDSKENHPDMEVHFYAAQHLEVQVISQVNTRSPPVHKMSSELRLSVFMGTDIKFFHVQYQLSLNRDYFIEIEGKKTFFIKKNSN